MQIDSHRFTTNAVTIAFCAMIASIFLYPQFVGQYDGAVGRFGSGAHARYSARLYRFGWPTTHLDKYEIRNAGTAPVPLTPYTWSMTSLFVNTLVCFVFIAATGITIHRLTNQLCWPLRFRLATLICFCAFLAITLAVVSAYPLIKSPLEVIGFRARIWDDPWWMKLAAGFGTACTTFVFLNVLALSMRLLISRCRQIVSQARGELPYNR
jgi:hypothetical protein